MWLSKNCCYERPYSVTGAIQFTGLKRRPKSICTDSLIGTQQVQNTVVTNCVNGSVKESVNAYNLT